MAWVGLSKLKNLRLTYKQRHRLRRAFVGYMGVAAEVAGLYLTMRSTRGVLSYTLLGLNVAARLLGRKDVEEERHWHDDLFLVYEGPIFLDHLLVRRMVAAEAHTVIRDRKKLLVLPMGDYDIRACVEPSDDGSIDTYTNAYCGPRDTYDHPEMLALVWGDGDKILRLHFGDDRGVLEDVVDNVVVSTEDGHALAERVLKHRKGRTILLYGDPGTGKTTVAMDIARRIGKTLIVSAEDLSHNVANVLAAVDGLSVDAVVIDDIDHIRDGDSKMLQFADRVKPRVKAVILTANDITKLDPALCRPMRVDIMQEVGHPDEALGNLLDGCSQDTWAALCTLPVVYAAAYHEVRRDEGIEAAEDEVEHLLGQHKFVAGMATKTKSIVDVQVPPPRREANRRPLKARAVGHSPEPPCVASEPGKK